MYTSQLSDLEELLKRHLPRDPNGEVTAHILGEWKRSLADADTVTLEWIQSYGPKLRATWSHAGGRTLASTARPPSRADSVRRFVTDWETYMRSHNRPSRVNWSQDTPS